MVTEQEVRKALSEIEQRHIEYFKENQKSIVDYINIYWSNPVYLSVKDNRLPIEISMDLCEIFEFI